MTDAERIEQSAKTIWTALSSWLNPPLYRTLLFLMLEEEIRRVKERAKLAPSEKKKKLKDLASKMGAAHAAMSKDSDS